MFRVAKHAYVILLVIACCSFLYSCRKIDRKSCPAQCEGVLLGGEQTKKSRNKRQDAKQQKLLKSCVKSCKKYGLFVVAWFAPGRPSRGGCARACNHYHKTLRKKDSPNFTQNDVVFGGRSGDQPNCVETCIRSGRKEQLLCVMDANTQREAAMCMRTR